MLTTLDSVDRKILNLLQVNSKLTNKQLSLQLNLSITAVYVRIKRLEREGYIDKYVALLKKETLNKRLTVFIHIKLLKHSEEYISDFEKKIINLEEVLECYHLSGDYDYIVKIHSTDMADYRRFLVEQLTSIAYIGSTQSSFSIAEVKYSTKILV